MLAPPEFPILCSLSELAKQLMLTKSGIKRASHVLCLSLSFAAPKKTYGSFLRDSPIRLSAAPGANKLLRNPIPSISFKMSSRPPSFANDLVLTSSGEIGSAQFQF